MAGGSVIGESQENDYRTFLARGDLRMQQCDDCRTWRHPARWICPECLSEKWSWQEPGGGATIEYIIWYNVPFDTRFTDTPYNVAIIRLDEGPRITTNILGAERPGDIAIGATVRLEIDPGDSGKARLLCRPA